MKKKRSSPEEIEFTDAELDTFAEFSDAGLAGKHPDIEEYLKRCPGSETRMRPLLETDELLRREITEFRRRFPDVDLGKLLDLKRKRKPAKK